METLTQIFVPLCAFLVYSVVSPYGRDGRESHGAYCAILPSLVRGLFLLIVAFHYALPAQAQTTLDDAAAALARLTAARVPPRESVRIVVRNVTALGASEAAGARRAYERSLRRALSNTPSHEISLTISETPRGYLLVAEVRHGEEQAVDMLAWQPGERPAAALPALEKRLIWEQSAPMLDVAVAGERMWVLERTRLVQYSRTDAGWKLASDRAFTAPLPRDARGHLTLAGETAGMHLPTDEASAPFDLAGIMVAFTKGRNTIEAPGLGAVMSVAGGGAGMFVARENGRVALLNGAREKVADIDGWGSDLASLPCGWVLASRASEPDAITAYGVASGKAVAMTEPLEMPGPVVALWPGADGAIAIARVAPDRYAAYQVNGCRR